MAWEELDLGLPVDIEGVHLAIREKTIWKRTNTWLEIIMGRDVFSRLGLVADEEDQKVRGRVRIAWGTGAQQGMLRVIPIDKAIPGLEIKSIRKGQVVKIYSKVFPSTAVKGFRSDQAPVDFVIGEENGRVFVEIDLPDGLFPARQEATEELVTVAVVEDYAKRLAGYVKLGPNKYRVGQAPDFDNVSVKGLLATVNAHRRRHSQLPYTIA